jgi:hypothetical protein
MDQLDTPQFRCRAGFARKDITPPVGIYHRLWGAATHERSTGVHRPLLATAMLIERPEGGDAQVIIALDQCLLDASDIARIQSRVAEATNTTADRVQVTVSHTHASGWMSLSRSAYPGGELIEPYLRSLPHRCADMARAAVEAAKPATIVFGAARCSLAAQRDYFDRENEKYVCGFNPDSSADDTVLVGKAIADDGTTLGIIVNYACHPTTLAWENTLLSPDFVGAMREVVERETKAPCLFLQGASGDLGPRDGFTGDVAVADRNGRQLGYAALSAIESLPPAGTQFRYVGPVVSGATLGIWKHEPADVDSAWNWRTLKVELPYREDLPTIAHSETELAKWEENEQAARALNDIDLARDCRAHAERMTRQLNRLRALPAGETYPYRVTIGRTGTVLWVLVPGELYQVFQMTLRSRFPNMAAVIATLTNDWQPGYLPTAESYGKGIYQETIAVVAPGSLEKLTETVIEELRIETQSRARSGAE